MKIFFLIAFFSVSISAFAQPGERILADKIIGIVGDKIVLKSDVENKLSDMVRQGVKLPPNATCYALEQDMNVKALVLQAEKDSLPITDEDIEIKLDARIRYFMQQYGSKDELERIAGKSIYAIKEELRTPIRDQELATAMRDKIVNDVRITPVEVQNYWSKIPADSLPYYESEVEIGQIVVYPKSSREADEYAIEQLNGFKSQVDGGKDIRTLATLYSDDPSAKQNGGQFEVNRTQKDYDPIWLNKAFTLKPGQVSNPFKSRFGYHIIQLMSRAGDDAVVRHILKIPEVTSFETVSGVKKMDSVRSQLIAGNLDFGTAVNKYSEEESAKFTAGMLQSPSGSTFLTIDQLEKDVIPALSKLEVGEYSQPIEFDDQRGKKGVKIIYLKSKSAPHRENLKEDYSKIADRALEGKKENALEEWFNTKLSTYYIKIDKEYSDCDVMERWVEAAKTHENLGK